MRLTDVLNPLGGNVKLAKLVSLSRLNKSSDTCMQASDSLLHRLSVAFVWVPSGIVTNKIIN